MRSRFSLALALGLVLAGTMPRPAGQVPSPPAGPLVEPLQPPPFEQWLEALIAEARQRGYSSQVIESTVAHVEPLHRVIESDRTQAEVIVSFDRYLAARVTRRVVRKGRELAKEHRLLLRRIQMAYGVPPSIVLAVWGLESTYGRSTGRTPIFQALTTLAWEPRRADFFRGELFDALTIVSRAYIEADRMKGSWAGAMGQTQFLPSSYLRYAVDFDGDGRRDIWSSTADALASMANYLNQYGWRAGETWGREVRASPAIEQRVTARVPKRTAGCYAMRNMTERRPLSQWQALGVRRLSGAALPSTKVEAALVHAGRRTFLVYDNYDALLGYNCAHNYALSVALLADRLK